MPPKRKDFLKPKGKMKAPEPQSENDFLDAADEFEQAAGKWRAGDAAKATRFFNRAIDMYNEGLKRYPKSFDLAYNKANLEYNITEDDRIVAQLGNRIALLAETLTSHRFAISLNPTNTDILFNAAQVLTTLAEASLEAGTQEAGKHEARPMLEEAVDIFTRCLEKQQQEYTQMQAEIAKAQASGEYREAWEDERQQPAEAPQEDMDEASSSSDSAGEWATVEEPITPDTILESCTAQLGALITLIGLYDPTTDLANIQKRVQDGLETATNRIPGLVELSRGLYTTGSAAPPEAGPTLSIGSTLPDLEDDLTPRDHAILAAANFQVSIAEVTFRSARSSPTEYAQAIEKAFAPLWEIAQHTGPTIPLIVADIESAYADALIDLASNIADGSKYTPASPDLADLDIIWTALTQAQSTLTKLASQTSILSSSKIADIFLARGDTDLFRFRVSLISSAKPAWIKSGPVLVGNAGVFYRGARSYAEKAGAAQVRATADAKAIVAEILKDVASGSTAAKDSWKGRSRDVARVLEQMVEEGVVGKENVEGVLILVQ